MPKAKIYNKHGYNRVRRTKFKLGANRKSSVSAHSLPTAALVAMLETCRGRDRSKINRILFLRG